MISFSTLSWFYFFQLSFFAYIFLCELTSRCETIKMNSSSYYSVTGNKSDELKNQKSFRNLQHSLFLKYYLSTFVTSSETWTKCWNETFFMKYFFVTIETRSARKNKILKRQHRNTTCKCIFPTFAVNFIFFLSSK